MTVTTDQEVVLEGRDQERFTFTGRLLGSGTSRNTHHSDHRDEFARRGERCSACRWFEVYIYRRSPNGYVVQTIGESVVPGEVRLSRIVETTNAYEIVELLTVRKRNTDPYIPPQSLRVLAQAAQYDDDVRDVYLDVAAA